MLPSLHPAHRLVPRNIYTHDDRITSVKMPLPDAHYATTPPCKVVMQGIQSLGKPCDLVGSSTKRWTTTGNDSRMTTAKAWTAASHGEVRIQEHRPVHRQVL